MRWKLSFVSFTLTLAMGIAIGFRPAMTEWMWPSFTKAEAMEKLGRRVRLSRRDKFRLMKCLNDNPCLEVMDGETGSVIGIEPVPDGGYFLKVRWDHPTDHYISYFGRYTHRESLVEREIVSSQYFVIPQLQIHQSDRSVSLELNLE